jgi:hypothetical protein
MTIEPLGEKPGAAGKHDRPFVIWRVERTGSASSVGRPTPAPMPVRQDTGPNSIGSTDRTSSDPATALLPPAEWPRVFPGL